MEFKTTFTGLSVPVLGLGTQGMGGRETADPSNLDQSVAILRAARTFCHVSDAVAALELIAVTPQAKGEIVHIGRDDEELTILDLTKRLLKLSGWTPELSIQDPPAGSVARRCPNITKLKSYGYRPRVMLNEGLQEVYDWYCTDKNSRR